MTPERWRRIEDLYHAALERDSGERPAFLRDACHDDSDLRREVDSLLSQGASGHLLNRSLGSVAADVLSERFAPGSMVGPYRIVEPLGAGGMGQVYRANDTRLGRDVALKVLPAEQFADPERRRRFLSEARAVSALSHPNIVTFYDLLSDGSEDVLVLEYVPGRTLNQLIGRGGLDLRDALGFAIQMADGLTAAHQAGIVHRDLKPSNVIVSETGTVKLLDFGLAKFTGVFPESERNPTLATADGRIMGTVAYMSPEQAQGLKVDARSDIFSFGVMLLEMLTGQNTFQRETATQTLAAILRDEFEPAESVPESLGALLGRCLKKNPARRAQSMADLKVALEDIREERERTASAPDTAEKQQSAWGGRLLAFVGVLAALTLILGLFQFRPRAAETPVLRFSILPPEQGELREFQLSPDGTRLAFVSNDSSGRTFLWLRSFDSLAPRKMPGTEGAAVPFWSPDGRFIGFAAEGKLRRIAADERQESAVPQVVADASDVVRGAAWSSAGVILFAGQSDGLYRVPASGGQAKPATTLDRSLGEYSHRWPQFLPDGNHFLYLVRSTRTANQCIYIGSLESQDRKRVLETPVSGGYAPGTDHGSGWLLFVRGESLLAQSFLLNGLHTVGEPVALADRVNSTNWRADFSVSATSLVYAEGRRSPDLELAMQWMDRTGKSIGAALKTASDSGWRSSDWRLSPDNRHLARSRTDGDIWVADLVRGTDTRLTLQHRRNWAPVWSPDGARIVFSSDRDGPGDLYEIETSSSLTERLLLQSGSKKLPSDWSRDGRYIVYHQQEAKGNWNLWTLPLSGGRRPIPLAQSAFNEIEGVFSPDGKWLAYASDETGQYQVYVQAFQPLGRAQGKWQVSNNGGTLPRWRGDGKELYYLAADRDVMAVPVKPGSRFQADVPKPLFRIRAPQYKDQDVMFDVPFAGSGDGQRFLVKLAESKSPVVPLHVVLNWNTALKR